MTKYTKKIREIVEISRSHPTAEQIFEELKKIYPKVVLATVYNNLNRLCSDGQIRRISSEGMPDRYDKLDRHDHLVCIKCGKLCDVCLPDLSGMLKDHAGSDILGYDLKLMYICDECKKRSVKD